VLSLGVQYGKGMVTNTLTLSSITEGCSAGGVVDFHRILPLCPSSQPIPDMLLLRTKYESSSRRGGQGGSIGTSTPRSDLVAVSYTY
jgi:hypothetical protein